jgi:outer membrane cobalamin receptor
MRASCWGWVGLALLAGLPALAAVEGGITGSVRDAQGVAVSAAKVEIRRPDGRSVRSGSSSLTGEFSFFPVEIGDYEVAVAAPGYAPYRVTVRVASGGNTSVEVRLSSDTEKEMVVEVRAKRRVVLPPAPQSRKEITEEDIQQLPQGDAISLPKLLTTTLPGVVQGSFNQTFFRGNHANIQYQIDGVQLPDSPSNTFGEAFSPRNIDHMEVITGGIPAEFGQRLSAVVNIVTKTGPEKPEGEIELNYGSYNTFAPYLVFGGSNESGSVHYFLSGNFSRTDRGIDTPQPANDGGSAGLSSPGFNQSQGGTDAIHDQQVGNSEFAKIDWQPDNDNKVSLVFFNADYSTQIPNYPSSFLPTDQFFSSGFTDQFMNQAPSGPTYNWVPSATDDNQFEANAYFQLIWRHTFSDRAFLQVAPYYKYSQIRFTGDPVNDLASESTPTAGSNPIAGSTPSSFSENRHVNNLGVKVDYTLRPNDANLFKTGFQLQASHADGTVAILTDLATPPVVDSSPDTGYFGGVYVQDQLTMTKGLVLDAGLRLDGTQFIFSDATPLDGQLEPRLGVSYMVTDTTKLHVYYGRLFQPAPVENLHDLFVATGASPCGAGQLCPYDIKAEKADFYETGIAQEVLDHIVELNAWYKVSINTLDDQQLLNTSIAQPFNYGDGYAYGLELSWKGRFLSDFSDFFNYSYEIAKGRNLSGGFFAVAPPDTSAYTFLDHCQIHTANAGVTYSKKGFWWTIDGIFGSGLRTGPDNTIELPSHLTFDTSLGYRFASEDWWGRVRVSGDVLNVFDNVYPINISNGFNGSHYAAGREFFIRVSKDL